MLCVKSYRGICATSSNPSKESLSLLCRAFLLPVLISVSVGWLPFFSLTKLDHRHQAASIAITCCFLPHPVPYLLSDASIPSLRVRLTRTSCYEWPLSILILFHISGLAGHEVKQGFFRCRRILASAHPLMPYFSWREALLACPTYSYWNPHPFSMERTLQAFSLTLPFLVKVLLLSALISSPLTISWFELLALSLLLLAKETEAFLPTARFVPLRLPFPIRQVKSAQVFSCSLHYSKSSSLVLATPTSLPALFLWHI